jgi:type IV pilus assembly protein PilX
MNSSTIPRTLRQRRDARGFALVFVLVMMAIATSVAVIGARTTLMAERSSRNDRDRQIAFQAAELALNDAELDIMDPTTDRGCLFGRDLIPNDNCTADSTDNKLRGFCGMDSALGDKPLYKDVDWEANTDTTRKYVNYGEFTGRDAALQVNTFSASISAPKYIVVQTTIPAVVPYGVGLSYQTTSAYHVYALGYGPTRTTQVLLEAVIAKPLLSSKCTGGTTL